MCGIAGIYCEVTPPSHDELEAMNDCLVHRGPDEGGIYQNGPIGLAHRRLSIIDLKTGRQPIYNEDKTVVVIANGEIYNHRSLRDELSEVGHQFSTDTDTEVLVHLYEEYGTDFVEHLEGMFAFAIWDENTKRLLLVRDPMGIKPLHVAIDDETVVFGSELNAIHASPIDTGGIDENAIAEYFAFGYIPAPKTAFKNVSKLQPGEQLIVEADGITKERYYEPNIESVTADFESAACSLRDRVKEAVGKRLMADVPLGAFLSGGIDSSIIVGVMSELSDDPVSTFTIGFGEEQFDETWAADAVAEYHDTDHHEYQVTPADVRELIPTIIDSLGEPFADSSILPTYVVARETRQEVTVALSGDGADELFGGYNKYRGEYFSKYYRAVPNLFRRGIIAPMVDRLPASRNTRYGEFFRMTQKFVRGADYELSERHYQWNAITTDRTQHTLPTLSVSDAGQNRIKDFHQNVVHSLPESRQDSLSIIQMSDTRSALPEGILNKVDRASMLNSLEVRVPFLDTDVFEFAMGLPTAYSITRTERKRILKEAFNDLLPEEILTRDKQGFEVPIGEWFKEELSTEFLDTLRKSDTDLVDTAAVETIYDEHVHGSKDHSHFLWAVYVFLKWYDRMDNRDILN